MLLKTNFWQTSYNEYLNKWFIYLQNAQKVSPKTILPNFTISKHFENKSNYKEMCCDGTAGGIPAEN